MQLLSYFKNLISNDLVEKLSTYLDENEVLVRRTIEVCIGTLLIGINNHKGKDSKLFLSQEITTNFESELDGFCAKEIVFPEGMYFVEQLFSIKKDRIPEMISNEICVKSATARAILNMVALLIMSNLKNDKPKEFESLLHEQYSYLSGLLPRGVRLVMGVATIEYAIPSVKKSEKKSNGFSFFRFKKNQ